MKLYRKISLILTMGIMFIGLTTFYITSSKGVLASGDNRPTQESQEDPDTAPTTAPTPTPTATPTPTPEPTPEPNDLKEAPEEIVTLIGAYLDAKINCSMEEFEQVVSDPSYIDLNMVQNETGAIKKYTITDCYVKNGTADIDYVAYCIYETSIPTIETPGVSIDYYYITKNSEGKPVIFLGELDEETSQYLDGLKYDDDVQQLIAEANERMAKAMENDADLKEFIEKLQNVPEGDSEG